MYDSFEQTKLWHVFKDKADKEKISTVYNLLRIGGERLAHVRDTFPTYTLHNELHSINIIGIMEELLGKDIDKLTGLEAALMILSAYYHDIGMVFEKSELESIQNEFEFTDFLEKFPKAELEIFKHQINNKQSSHPEEIVEWYCRWVHPIRSNNYILKNEDINWGVLRINEPLAKVCLSHGYDISEILKWNGLAVNFATKADLLFCAILLRLADLLDFDNTRSPKDLYDSLRLFEEKNQREKVSNGEWKKHLSSDGFSIPDQKSKRYSLDIIASPKEPKIEFELKNFLNIVEYELRQCEIALTRCQKRWTNFKLPYTIRRDSIISNGYYYGDFKFTLDHDVIFELLFGTNLYYNSDTFIRELAQNAIDTSRHRELYEHAKGEVNFKAEPITFKNWTDDNGSYWIQIDDYGMGMDLEIIMGYFLKIGKSYYKSDIFKLEQLKLKEISKVDFTPISRFGIGFLSCFMLGDEVQVSTRRVSTKKQKNAIVMKLEDAKGFFSVYLENQHPFTMASPKGHIGKYRKFGEFGTSISIRMNPRKMLGRFDLLGSIQKFIFCAPIPITFDDELIGGDRDRTLKRKWISQPQNSLPVQ